MAIEERGRAGATPSLSQCSSAGRNPRSVKIGCYLALLLCWHGEEMPVVANLRARGKVLGWWYPRCDGIWVARKQGGKKRRSRCAAAAGTWVRRGHGAAGPGVKAAARRPREAQKRRPLSKTAMSIRNPTTRWFYLIKRQIWKEFFTHGYSNG